MEQYCLSPSLYLRIVRYRSEEHVAAGCVRKPSGLGKRLVCRESTTVGVGVEEVGELQCGG